MAVSGNNLRVQVGAESTYGTVPAMTNQVKVFSESLAYNPAKKEEGLLTGMRSVGRSDTMSKSVEGDLSFLFRPDDGLFLALALGEEGAVTPVAGTTGSFTHTFDAVDSITPLPHATLTIDRVVDQFAYTGLSVGSLAFTAAPEDYLKIDASFVGRDETSGTMNESISVSPLKAFKFRQASVKIGGVAVADVTDIKFNYDNALTSNQQTTSTGEYFMKPEPGARAITADIEVVYSAAADTLRNSYFKTDDEVSLDIEFVSDEVLEVVGVGEEQETIYNSLRIYLPHTQITECSANIGSADLVKQTMKLAAFESTNGLVDVELVNSRETKYL